MSFFSALWMVFPESWKRRAADFYAHHCKYIYELYLLYKNQKLFKTLIRIKKHVDFRAHNTVT